ncbi:MAG: dienelactone hydrolase family protein [Armatimonadetes bacterium]|nr:dienelactone hydrolase family protein [Armatimonadota bacterium]MDE2207302.1 dienelactone hydrolase family protein [Armatimonadota bacterium]
MTSHNNDKKADSAETTATRRDLLAGAAASVLVRAGSGQTDREMTPTERALADSSIAHANCAIPPGPSASDRATINGFLAEPHRKGKRAGVIVIHEIFGVTDHIKSIACRFAEAGYTAVAPDFFSRKGAPPDAAGGFQPLMEFVNRIPDKQVLGDIDSAAAYLNSLSNSSGRIGVAGFCYGGRFAMLSAAECPLVNAAAAWYGRIAAGGGDQKMAPLDVVASMHAPLIGHFGAEDTSIPVADVGRLRDALKAAHKSFELYEYAGAGHAFNNDTRPMYRPEAAHLSWERTLHWFARWLRSAA